MDYNLYWHSFFINTDYEMGSVTAKESFFGSNALWLTNSIYLHVALKFILNGNKTIPVFDLLNKNSISHVGWRNLCLNETKQNIRKMNEHAEANECKTIHFFWLGEKISFFYRGIYKQFK